MELISHDLSYLFIGDLLEQILQILLQPKAVPEGVQLLLPWQGLFVPEPAAGLCQEQQGSRAVDAQDCQSLQDTAMPSPDSCRSCPFVSHSWSCHSLIEVVHVLWLLGKQAFWSVHSEQTDCWTEQQQFQLGCVIFLKNQKQTQAPVKKRSPL